MIWDSWQDFFAMGGYGLYVWGSFIVTFGFMAGEVVSLRMRAKATRAALLKTLNARRKAGHESKA
jgi:heme exporter protein D